MKKVLIGAAAAAAIAFAPFSVIAAPAAHAAPPCGSGGASGHVDLGLFNSPPCTNCISNTAVTHQNPAICFTDVPSMHYPDCDGLEPIAASNCVDKHMLDGDPGQPG
jgi:hypothetical protein